MIRDIDVTSAIRKYSWHGIEGVDTEGVDKINIFQAMNFKVVLS